MSATIHPYGTWPSPLTAAHVAAEGVGSSATVKELRVEDDNAYWLEPRPAEGGRSVIMHCNAHGTITTLTPAPFNVRSRVHEYGGGAYAVHDGVVYFVDSNTQRIYRHALDEEPAPITPVVSGRKQRFGDLTLSPDGNDLLAVRETILTEGVENDLVVVSAKVAGPPRVLESGCDFYSSPRFSPDGKQLAWLSWNSPSMPWDQSSLSVADYREGVLSHKRVLYAVDGVSVIQPDWSPEGVLHALIDATGWWNLYAFEDGHPVPIHPTHREIGSVPWVFGLNDYAFLDDNRIVWIAHESGIEQLEKIEHNADRVEALAPEVTSLFPSCLQVDARGRIWFVCGTFSETPHIAVYEPGRRERKRIYPLQPSPVLPGSLSRPASLFLSNPDGGTDTHVFFYPPFLAGTTGPADALPPLLVYAHSGPTSAARPFLQLEIQFWTSRGFAVAVVNYRGSTGFGRNFRRSLAHAWGIHDADDCLHAAEELARSGRVDPARMVIRGRSAGGYTVLRALMRSSLFAAGTSYYGISDLLHLQSLSPKFEAHYLTHLIGDPANPSLYRERSPVHHADALQAPLLLFQGEEDPVVPREQAERMAAVLAAREHPFEYVSVPNEGHGFRRAENIERCLEKELRFYRKVLNLG